MFSPLVRRFAAIVVLTGLVAGHGSRSETHAAEWPQFRGPAGNGHATGTGLPAKWSEQSGVRFKAAIPGKGHSSPVIGGDQIWLTTAIETPLSEAEKERRLAKVKNSRGLNLAGRLSLRAVCVDRPSGRIVHDRELIVVDDPEPIHSLNSYASPTPVIDEWRLFCHFGTYGTACLDRESGKVLWKNTDLKVDHQNGPGSSLLVWRNLVVLHLDGIDQQFVAAVDKQTGKLVWKTKRSGKLNERPELQKAYCTPIVLEDESGPQLISQGADWVYSYDPNNGKELWRIAYGELGFSTVPRPVVGHGMVFLCTSYMQSRLLAVRYDGRGDVSDTHVEWSYDRQVPKKPSILLVGGELYFVSDGGIASCLDAKTGQLHWRERLPGEYSASPLYADGRIYFFSQDGSTSVIAPGSEFRLLARNQLDGGFMASPAVAGSDLFLRTQSHLYRVSAAAAE